MSEHSSPIERMLERTARAVSGRGVHPAELLSRIQAAYLAGAAQGLAPNRLTVRLHPEDHAIFGPAFAALRAEVAAMLEDESRRAGLQHIGDLLVEFVPDAATERGIPVAVATFADTSHPRTAAPTSPTVTMQRHRQLALLVDGAERVVLTHTPFTIGRGPGNDLVLPSLAVSRVHARIVADSGRFVLEDLGGRNGVQLNGVGVPAAVLGPGVVVRLGDITVELVEAR